MQIKTATHARRHVMDIGSVVNGVQSVVLTGIASDPLIIPSDILPAGDARSFAFRYPSVQHVARRATPKEGRTL